MQGPTRLDGAAREPRLAVVFLGAASEPERLLGAIERIPRELLDGGAVQIAVLLRVERPDQELPAALLELERSRQNLTVLPDPRGYGHGGRRKVAFEYVLQRDFDHVVVLEPDGRHPPERIGELWTAARAGAELVIASSGARTPLHGLVLGLEVRDYASPYRLIACRALRRVPFHLNQDGRGFDTELLIQCRALGVVAREVEMNLERDPSFDVARSLWIALGYRAHQLHLTRRGQYFVDRDVRYTLKRHSSSSHKQIIDAVRPGTLVLDLGCSQGLLAAPLARKEVRVVGVDVGEPSQVSDALETYYRRDLEQPLDIPEGRVFDYVVCSDVIEHVVRPTIPAAPRMRICIGQQSS